MNRSYGRHYIRDLRDRDYRLSLRRSRRTSRYWRSSWFGDQGETSQCVGYAFAHWLESAPHRQFLSPAGIYQFAQHVDEWEGTDYEGTSVRGGAKALQALGFIESYLWTWDVEELVRCVLEVGPVVVGTEWHDGMDNADDMQVTGGFLGGHAYLVDGVSTKTRMFRVKNSWADWGRRQRGRMSFDVMQQLLDADGECCIGVEQDVLAKGDSQ